MEFGYARLAQQQRSGGGRASSTPAERLREALLVSEDPRLTRLEENARHTDERYRLYKARVLGRRSSSATRLRELQRESELAAMRLAAARSRRS
jgi:hypothetical protein